tara:strand:+ start:1325 stop:1534 length:210 start_codon:yes stop_codon:yes gene_type:complete
MKPRSIRQEEIKYTPGEINSTDSLISKKVRIETPLGNIESDSGNHLVDVGTVILILLIFFVMRKFFNAT